MSTIEKDTPISNSEQTPALKQEDRTSTTMSEASIEHSDEELKPDTASQQPYTYINQKAEDWPQFSIEHRKQTQIAAEEPTEDIFKLFFNRGTDSVMRTKLMSHVKRLAGEIKQERKDIVVAQGQNDGFNIRDQVNKRMRGWRNWEDFKSTK